MLSLSLLRCLAGCDAVCCCFGFWLAFGDVCLAGCCCGDFAGELCVDFAGDLCGDFAGDLCGDFAGELCGDFAGELCVDFAGDFAGGVDLCGEFAAAVAPSFLSLKFCFFCALLTNGMIKEIL